METDSVRDYFEKFIVSPSIFQNKKVLLSNYNPLKIEFRHEQMTNLAKILAPALRGDKPSNIFIYGKTGTGKTLTVQHTTSQLLSIAEQRGIALKIIYLNCKLKRVADTEYRLVAEVCRFFGKNIPPTGLPTDEVYNIFYKTLDESNTLTLLILDEIDQLIGKAGDELLYNLTRINSQLRNTQLSIIGISNDIRFIDYLDPRVKSSLSEEEMIFPPYNALQLQGILKSRAADAFAPGVVDEGVIEKCAAIAAREHGDARRALELLRVAAELAERAQDKKLTLKYLDNAEDTIEHDRIIDMVKAQPTQYQVSLYAILSLFDKKNEECIFTGDIYNNYCGLCAYSKIRPLTQRRVSDIIAEFDTSGIINAKTISKGRYGRTREITMSLPQNSRNEMRKVLEEALSLPTGII